MFVVNISYPLMKTVIEQVRQALVDNIDEKTRQNAQGFFKESKNFLRKRYLLFVKLCGNQDIRKNLILHVIGLIIFMRSMNRRILTFSKSGWTSMYPIGLPAIHYVIIRSVLLLRCIRTIFPV